MLFIIGHIGYLPDIIFQGEIPQLTFQKQYANNTQIMECYSLINERLRYLERKENDDMAKSKLAEVNEKIAEGVVGGYKKIEEGVVGGYKKIEEGAVGGFNKVADKFVDNFLTKEGESVEEAKARMAAEQDERRQKQKSVMEAGRQKAEASKLDAGRKAGIEK